MSYQFPSRFGRAICMLIFVSAFVMMSGCDANKNVAVGEVAIASAPKALTVPRQRGKRLHLTIAGYNYTNRYIDYFRVNDQWGGNLSVSAPGSGGGGSVCCVTYFDREGRTTVTVRWQSGACYFTTKSTISNNTYQNLHSFFKEVEVELDKSRAHKPNYLEVHFYPDGTVKAAVTDETSSPSMTVDPETEDRSTFPRCPNDKEPL
jgi:hypothetical protein